MSALEPPRQTFPSSPQSMAAVRQFVEKVTAAHPKCSEAVLVADELATNAYQHASTDEFTVAVLPGGEIGSIVITVAADSQADTVPHVCPGGGLWGRDDGERGRGMVIVDALAATWGFGQLNGQQVVYAVLHAAGDEPC